MAEDSDAEQLPVRERIDEMIRRLDSVFWQEGMMNVAAGEDHSHKHTHTHADPAEDKSTSDHKTQGHIWKLDFSLGNSSNSEVSNTTFFSEFEYRQ